jgi:hypothetical protein
MDVKLNITADALNELTWEQWSWLESKPTIGQAREICANFLIDDNGDPIPYDKALSVLGKAKGTQISEVINALVKKFQEMQVPPEKPSE